MKKVFLATAMVTAAFLCMNETKAQSRFGVTGNTSARPDWGLAGNSAGGYYYLPEIDTYYDITSHHFIYFNNGRWIFDLDLPAAYRDYDLYNGYKVIVSEAQPYVHANVYRDRYSNYFVSYQSRRAEILAQREKNYNGNRFDNNRKSDGKFHLSREGEQNRHSEQQSGRSTITGSESENNNRNEQQFDNSRTTGKEAENNNRIEQQPVKNVVSGKEIENNNRIEQQPVKNVVSGKEAENNNRIEQQPVKNVVTGKEAENNNRIEQQPAKNVATGKESENTNRSSDQPYGKPAGVVREAQRNNHFNESRDTTHIGQPVQGVDTTKRKG